MTTQAQNTHTILRAEGFTCPSCVSRVEKQLKKLDGVQDVTVHFASSRVEIDHDSRQSVADLIAAVEKAGYKAKASAF